ncbi:Panacea domain-containing protein [Roseibium sp. RKSG952]|uniref:Panacea domain-containing protein n=1 Tax=Roseibium sp. RKSG952 TaxID=2529384 RepID=UPI0012BC4796|nr:type II toxin-antitoxin system antitoxin SocA domain-containing protein [Roseibium sp. RKSG952]MTH95348.1 DUF4065 domain-containing protein [Roseibium sp. RKSG952]
MAYEPSFVANAFLNRAREESIKDVDQLKIQKLVYCLHGWYLATQNAPLVGEYYEAWPYGPVLSSLYHEFKYNGRKPIKSYAIDVDPKTGEDKALMVGVTDKKFYSLFDVVWNRYKRLNGLQLSSLAHAEGAPWSLARARGETYLSNDEIRTHFRALALTAREKSGSVGFGFSERENDGSADASVLETNWPAQGGTHGISGSEKRENDPISSETAPRAVP